MIDNNVMAELEKFANGLRECLKSSKETATREEKLLIDYFYDIIRLHLEFKEMEFEVYSKLMAKNLMKEV